MSFTEHKNIFYEKVSLFKRFTEKSVKITGKITLVRLFNLVFSFICVK